MSFDLLLAFDSDDPEFIRGFEMGRMWALLRTDEGDTQDFMIHANNAEMAIRIAEATDRPWRVLSQTDEWVDIEFGAVGAGIA